MFGILFYTIGIFISFGIIELIYSSSFLPTNFIYIVSPLILTMFFLFIERKTKKTVIFPTTAAILSILATISFTVLHIQDISIDNFTITAIVYFVISFLFSICSAYIKQNRIFGIRTSATLKYKQVWDKTHKIYFMLSCFSLPFLYTLIFWYSGSIRFILLNIIFISPGIICYFVSYIISKPYVNSEHLQHQNELNQQKKLEEEGKYK